MITVTIGIPAYNEEENILHLLKDITQQEYTGCFLQEIIVISDGSKDKTEELVAGFKHRKLRLIADKSRKGLAARQNELCENAQSDVLIIIQADTRIRDRYFVQKLLSPIQESNADLVSVRTQELRGNTFIERALILGMAIKRRTAESYKSGANVYTCCGLARALSRKLYTSIHFKNSVGEDAFSYFYACTNNFKYAYVRNTSIIYKVASRYSEHKRQTIRFFQSQSLMSTYFGKRRVMKEYAVPRNKIIHGFLWGLQENVLLTVTYVLTVVLAKFEYIFRKASTSDTWDVARSSKRIHV